MTVRCSVCNHENPDGSGFCVRCGNALASTPPIAPAFAYSAGYASPAAGQGTTPLVQQIAQMGTGQGAVDGSLSYRRAFAGYGISVMHHSWLLDGKHVHATDLQKAVQGMLFQRKIAGVRYDQKRLRERGYQTEMRDFLLIQRGVTTVFIYIAPAGQDLYISRATVILPSIDLFRVIALCLLLFAAFFGPGLLSGSLGSIGGLLLGGIFSLFITWPILIYLGYYLILSLKYLLLENDFWIYLRSRDLNDFQIDDIMLLEHVTDETVHNAVEQLGLDASKIVPPTQGYQRPRQIRIA